MPELYQFHTSIKQTTVVNMTAMIAALLAFVAVAAHAAPVENSTPIPILSYSFDGPNPDGSYAYQYETGNGIKVQEDGALKQINEKEVAMNVQGAYSYLAEDGTPITVTYVANENGFQPKGAHLPTPPPIPTAILRALEYIAAHPEEDDKH